MLWSGIPKEPLWSKVLRRQIGLPKPVWLSKRLHPYPEQFSPAADLPPYRDAPRLYLIATTPRTGSHFLSHAIHSGRSFGFPLEYLNRENLAIWSHRFGARSTAETLQRLFEVRTGTAGWFGLKAHWNQFNSFPDKALFEGFGGFRKALWIYRRDLLGQAVSRSMAEQSGQWISGARRRGRSALHYDHAQVIRNATTIRKQNRKWQAFFAETFPAPVLRVVYEDLLADQAGQFARIASFLDAAGATDLAPARTERQASGLSQSWKARFAERCAPEERWILDPQDF